MPTRELLSAVQRARFSALPELDARALARHHSLSEDDLTAVSVRRGAANRLGFAVQLCLLRYPGRSLRAGEAVPRPIVEFVASQVGADPDAFRDYAGGPEGAGRDTTRREHASEIVRTFGFRSFDGAAYR
jgi:TnpA family transposase